nr:valine--tRNA ligase [Ardenticatenales bacterium]
MATQDLPKTYDPREVEVKLYQWWEESGFFRAEIDWEKEPFVIAMPPPNVTGELHMGHAMFVTLEDIMTRYHRMTGKPSLWLPGTDHAGIATQLQVEKQLMKEGKTRFQVGREDFEEMLWEWKERYGGYITKQLRRLGASCDWSRERFTLDEGLSDAVGEAFIRLYEKGLIYRGSYLVNWSPNLQTAVSDLEVEYSTEPGTLYFFKYRLKDSDEFIPVATTRPETILGDTAVAVHPEDERYAHLIGQTVLVPMLDREIPVIGDAYVEREFGTGALKVTPAHDPNDYEIAKRHNLPLLNIMNKDATLNEEGGPYMGLSREEGRKRLWADMKEAGLTIKEQPHQLNVPRSQRGGEIVEPMVSTQWFVKMESLAAAGLAAVRDGRIKIVPERFEKVYYNWLENIRDWPISRQLWWG